MLLRDIITEMPIRVRNINVGRPESSFRSDDIALATSPKGLKKIADIWKNSVVDVDVYLLDVGIDPEKALDIAISGDDSYYSRANPDAANLTGMDGQTFDPESISVIFTNNDGSNRIPLTGWIIAHRLFHTFQSDRVSRYHTANSSPRNLTSQAGNIGIQFEAVMSDIRNAYTQYQYTPTQKKQLAEMMGTTRACRMGNLTTAFELVPECFAQYMLTGRTTLQPLVAVDKNVRPEDLAFCNQEIKSFESYLNRNFETLVRDAVGRVVAL